MTYKSFKSKKKIEKNLPFILYCAGWAVIDILFTTSKKDLGPAGPYEGLKIRGKGNQECGGYDFPPCLNLKKICGVTALRPCFLPETKTFLADCTFYHLCFQLVVCIAFSDPIILVQYYMSFFNWKTCSNHSFVCDASF